MIVVDAVTGDRRPTSGAFKPDDDGVSVYRDSKLTSAGLGPRQLVKNPINLIVSLDVGDVRAVPLGVRDDPWPSGVEDERHPRNAAHALIVGWDGLGKGERRRRQKALTMLPSLIFAYP